MIEIIHNTESTMGIVVLIRLIIFLLVGWLLFQLVRNWLNRRPQIKKTNDEKIKLIAETNKIILDHIIDWEGITENGEKVPCNDKYKKIVSLLGTCSGNMALQALFQ